MAYVLPLKLSICLLILAFSDGFSFMRDEFDSNSVLDELPRAWIKRFSVKNIRDTSKKDESGYEKVAGKVVDDIFSNNEASDLSKREALKPDSTDLENQKKVFAEVNQKNLNDRYASIDNYIEMPEMVNRKQSKITQTLLQKTLNTRDVLNSPSIDSKQNIQTSGQDFENVKQIDKENSVSSFKKQVPNKLESYETKKTKNVLSNNVQSPSKATFNKMSHKDSSRDNKNVADTGFLINAKSITSKLKNENVKTSDKHTEQALVDKTTNLLEKHVYPIKTSSKGKPQKLATKQTSQKQVSQNSYLLSDNKDLNNNDVLHQKVTDEKPQTAIQKDSNILEKQISDVQGLIKDNSKKLKSMEHEEKQSSVVDTLTKKMPEAKNLMRENKDERNEVFKSLDSSKSKNDQKLLEKGTNHLHEQLSSKDLTMGDKAQHQKGYNVLSSNDKTQNIMDDSSIKKENFKAIGDKTATQTEAKSMNKQDSLKTKNNGKSLLSKSVDLNSFIEGSGSSYQNSIYSRSAPQDQSKSAKPVSLAQVQNEEVAVDNAHEVSQAINSDQPEKKFQKSKYSENIDLLSEDYFDALNVDKKDTESLWAKTQQEGTSSNNKDNFDSFISSKPVNEESSSLLNSYEPKSITNAKFSSLNEGTDNNAYQQHSEENLQSLKQENDVQQMESAENDKLSSIQYAPKSSGEQSSLGESSENANEPSPLAISQQNSEQMKMSSFDTLEPELQHEDVNDNLHNTQDNDVSSINTYSQENPLQDEEIRAEINAQKLEQQKDNLIANEDLPVVSSEVQHGAQVFEMMNSPEQKSEYGGAVSDTEGMSEVESIMESGAESQVNQQDQNQDTTNYKKSSSKVGKKSHKKNKKLSAQTSHQTENIIQPAETERIKTLNEIINEQGPVYVEKSLEYPIEDVEKRAEESSGAGSTKDLSINLHSKAESITRIIATLCSLLHEKSTTGIVSPKEVTTSHALLLAMQKSLDADVSVPLANFSPHLKKNEKDKGSDMLKLNDIQERLSHIEDSLKRYMLIQKTNYRHATPEQLYERALHLKENSQQVVDAIDEMMEHCERATDLPKKKYADYTVKFSKLKDALIMDLKGVLAPFEPFSGVKAEYDDEDKFLIEFGEYHFNVTGHVTMELIDQVAEAEESEPFRSPDIFSSKEMEADTTAKSKQGKMFEKAVKEIQTMVSTGNVEDLTKKETMANDAGGKLILDIRKKSYASELPEPGKEDERVTNVKNGDKSKLRKTVEGIMKDVRNIRYKIEPNEQKNEELKEVSNQLNEIKSQMKEDRELNKRNKIDIKSIKKELKQVTEESVDKEQDADELDSITSNINGIKEKLDQEKQDIEEKNEELNELKQDLNNLKTKRSSDISRNVAEDFNDDNDEINELGIWQLIDHIEKKRSKKESANIDIDGLQSHVSSVVEKVEDLHNTINDLFGLKTSLDDKYSVIDEPIDLSNNLRNSDKFVSHNALQSDLASLNNPSDSIFDINSNVKNDFAQFQNDVAKVQKQIASVATAEEGNTFGDVSGLNLLSENDGKQIANINEGIENLEKKINEKESFGGKEDINENGMFKTNVDNKIIDSIDSESKVHNDGGMSKKKHESNDENKDKTDENMILYNRILNQEKEHDKQHMKDLDDGLLTEARAEKEKTSTDESKQDMKKQLVDEYANLKKKIQEVEKKLMNKQGKTEGEKLSSELSKLEPLAMYNKESATMDQRNKNIRADDSKISDNLEIAIVKDKQNVQKSFEEVEHNLQTMKDNEKDEDNIDVLEKVKDDISRLKGSINKQKKSKVKNVIAKLNTDLKAIAKDDDEVLNLESKILMNSIQKTKETIENQQVHETIAKLSYLKEQDTPLSKSETGLFKKTIDKLEKEVSTMTDAKAKKVAKDGIRNIKQGLGEGSQNNDEASLAIQNVAIAANVLANKKNKNTEDPEISLTKSKDVTFQKPKQMIEKKTQLKKIKEPSQVENEPLFVGKVEKNKENPKEPAKDKAMPKTDEIITVDVDYDNLDSTKNTNGNSEKVELSFSAPLDQKVPSKALTGNQDIETNDIESGQDEVPEVNELSAKKVNFTEQKPPADISQVEKNAEEITAEAEKAMNKELSETRKNTAKSNKVFKSKTAPQKEEISKLAEMDESAAKEIALNSIKTAPKANTGDKNELQVLNNIKSDVHVNTAIAKQIEGLLALQKQFQHLQDKVRKLETGVKQFTRKDVQKVAEEAVKDFKEEIQNPYITNEDFKKVFKNKVINSDRKVIKDILNKLDQGTKRYIDDSNSRKAEKQGRRLIELLKSDIRQKAPLIKHDKVKALIDRVIQLKKEINKKQITKAKSLLAVLRRKKKPKNKFKRQRSPRSLKTSSVKVATIEKKVKRIVEFATTDIIVKIITVSLQTGFALLIIFIVAKLIFDKCGSNNSESKFSQPKHNGNISPKETPAELLNPLINSTPIQYSESLQCT